MPRGAGAAPRGTDAVVAAALRLADGAVPSTDSETVGASGVNTVVVGLNTVRARAPPPRRLAALPLAKARLATGRRTGA
ncbi:MAG: hypothetical protein AB8H79_16275 [Myxococcota bacterium]